MTDVRTDAASPPGFWKSSGYHLVRRNADGWLDVSEDLLRAYFTRPEVHPTDESCAAEHRLFEALMEAPFRPVEAGEIEAIADQDTRDNYGVVLRWRDLLRDSGTLENAYLSIVRSGAVNLPPMFIDQLVTLTLRNILDGATDPMRVRAAELFFREQTVSIDDGRVMLADEEIVETYAETGGMGGLGQLILEAGSLGREVSLDVLDDDNKKMYWDRSDRFDTVIDFRFTQPAVDAFARVVEAWVAHFLGLSVRVLPMQSIKDDRWSWHVGLDADATAILNALYQGDEVGVADMERIIALFRLEFREERDVLDTMRGKPVYLGLAMSPGHRLRVKPQNLLTNLPLRARD